MEQIKANELNDRNLWRRKGKKHAAKRKGSKLTLYSDKKRRVDEESQERSTPGRKVSDCFLNLMRVKALGMQFVFPMKRR